MLLCGAGACRAGVPEFAPYRPLYPGLYLDAAFEHDPADESFDAGGHRRSTALPNRAGESDFSSDEAQLRLAWTFPMFEQENLPFFSHRLHTARVNFSWRDLDSGGAIADFIDARPALKKAQGGLGDLWLEFGSWLSGSEGWREGRTGPVSTLLLFGVKVPVGVYDRDAPASAGSNHLSAQLRLGAHASPWRGGMVDAGVGYRVQGRNEEPEFGALAPAEPGDELLWDVQVSQRLLPGLHFALAASGSEGQANRYDDPRFATQPTAPLPGSDIAPVPGRYRDHGADSRLARASLRWFVTQRLAAGLHFTHPISGRSGEFDVDLQQRTPAGCDTEAPTCLAAPAGREREDGLASARSLASDRIAVSLTWQFGQGDTWTCPGCAD